MSGARRSPGPAVTSTARAITQRLYNPRWSPRSSWTTPQIVFNVIASAAPLGFEQERRGEYVLERRNRDPLRGAFLRQNLAAQLRIALKI